LHKTSNHEKKEILLEYLEVVINTFTRDLKQYKNPNNESFEKKLQELGNYMFLKKVIEESQPG
jgi:ABC-type transporter MlaC component